MTTQTPTTLQLNLWFDETLGREILYMKLPTGTIVYVETEDGARWAEGRTTLDPLLDLVITRMWNRWKQFQEVAA